MRRLTKQMDSLPNCKRENLAERVFETLRERILSGAVQRGELLPPQQLLARQLGVSRTVIREALHKLSSLGLIETQQGRGTYVRSPNTASVMRPIIHALFLNETSAQELFETRFYLERATATLAASRAKPTHIAALRKTILDMEEHVRENNLEACTADDVSFHLALADASNNAVLRRVLETLREMMVRFLERFKRLDGASESALRYHKRILRAVEEGDPEQAEKEMEQHLLDVVSMLRDHYDYDLKISGNTTSRRERIPGGPAQ
jgi:GntR family transcriptional repressor for pyruvate dehydrogenase complex